MNAFIIGAGFAKAVIPDSPLNDELLDALTKNKPDPAARTLRDYGTNKIEFALTKFDCDHPSGTGLRQELEKELGDYFSSPSFLASEKLLVEHPWLTSSIDHVFRKGDVVVSLNYDCLLEGVIVLVRTCPP
jgi:hypothetical protein